MQLVDMIVVMQSVKKMLDSGLSVDVIISTLEDIGLSEEEAGRVVSEAQEGKGGQGSRSQPGGRESVDVERENTDRPLELHERIAEATSRRLSEQLREQQDLSELTHTAATVAIESHSNKIDDVQRNVERLHESFQDLQSRAVVASPELVGKVNALQAQLTALSSDVSDVKALTKALQTVLKKVLETDRDVLANLQKKH